MSRLDAPDRLVEDDDRDVVRVALRLVVEGIGVERAGVEPGLRGVLRVEGDVDGRCAYVAVRGGQKDGRGDQGSRTIGVGLSVEGADERPDVGVPVAVGLPIGDGRSHPAAHECRHHYDRKHK